MTGIFKSEQEMQLWLSSKLKELEGLSDLIINIDDFQEYKPQNLSDRKIFESFNYCLSSLNIVDIISENENISLNPSDSLRPDFLLYAQETEAIVIVELKNIVTPSRQAGTEISAYGNEVKTYIPFISDGDIINVIISPVWSTLLKHYVFHEIFWQQRNLLCLEPVKEDNEIKLKIVDVASIAEDTVSFKLCNEHIGGYQVCLYDENLYLDPQNRTRLDPFIAQMKTAMSAMASKGNAQKNHGFAFLWKDGWDLSIAPYNISVFNFAPFQSFERHFHNENFEPNIIANKFIDIIRDYDPLGHGKSLMTITSTGQKFLSNFCSPHMEGFHNWDHLSESMLTRCNPLISFKCWGAFEEVLSDKILQKYQAGESDISFDDPHLGLEVINELIDPNYQFYNLSYLEETSENDNLDDLL
ncbi:TPA: hypothetical protein ACG0AR_000132 [Elizabethkingia anophelis]|nr:hypothetical protein [Elizabethkingia anophelis]MDV3683928.1 hypothetical protein [Elizabethkingia anophelis]MDV3699547.1 hypothetical protein [Elizabethkingia anophelis]MDV3761952.1 hypothetical protein [Elizabethkingia anophelis]MDV3800669.1 hypothetical protein [Elizabethkingia anophelis]